METETPLAEDATLPVSLSTPDGAGPDVPWSNVDLEAEAARSPPPPGPASAAVYPLGLQPSGAEEEVPAWAWISGGGCDVDASSHISWLSPTGPLSSSLSLTPVQSTAWSDQQEEKEAQRDGSSKQPLERSTSVWVRRSSMRWWRDWKPQRWVEVGVALEQSTNQGRRDCIFFIYYTQYGEKKCLHVFLGEVTALVPVLGDVHHAFAVYTAERTRQRWPLLLAAGNQQDMDDWLALLLACCCESRGLSGPPSRQALWSVTSKGDVMVHEPSASLEANAHTLPCDLLFWRQVPGHLRCVECNSLGVVWGVGRDGTAWVYTGHRRDEPAQGEPGVVQTQTDVRSVYIYENQRWNPMTGYSDKGLPRDRAMWSDESGLKECTKTNTHPPSPQWTWVTEWAVDLAAPGGTDKEGWQYAAGFNVTFHGHKTIKDFVRRRRWARRCRISLRAPWQQVPPVALSDITVLPCLAQSSVEQVPVWALSDKGDVLCRLGVTPARPEGTSWLHVGTDQPFKSISIGGANQVWAIAGDGAVFYRGSVSPHNPAGECWYHIPSPLKQVLKQLSVGRTSVYAVDQNGNLWYRQGLTPSYPQGSAWELVSNNVTSVSVGPLDQVWIIADKVPGFPTETTGAVCHRLGVGPMQPKGQSWDYGIGGGWEHISVRGNATDTRGPPHPTAALCGTPQISRSPLAPRPSTPCSPLPPRPSTPRSTLPAVPREQANGNAGSHDPGVF